MVNAEKAKNKKKIIITFIEIIRTLIIYSSTKTVSCDKINN